MVTGLNLFRDHFAAYGDRYVLIGGAACDMLMQNAGLPFRATKDLDIVLCIEALDAAFVQTFWNFVRDGAYQQQQNAAGRPTYYRFAKPEQRGYPYMLELFARKPDLLGAPRSGAHLTPIPVEECSSLSAILMDDTYYAFLQGGKIQLDGITLLNAEHLIPLKARAWLDLGTRRQAGIQVDSKAITKHRNDVIRLFQLLDPNAVLDIPNTIAYDMDRFLKAMATESVNLNALGIRALDLGRLLDKLRVLYVEGH